MDRREILKYAAAITGTAICAPLTATLLSGCSKQPAAISTETASASMQVKTAFFDADTFTKLTRIMDVILPKTDTPSASEVKVNMIMDNMFHKVFKAKYKNSFLTSFKQLDQYLTLQGFESASLQQQTALLTQIEKTKDNSQGFKAYIDVKQQSIAYYLSTEEIAENHLNYLPIPGAYTPCISVKEVGGKAWAE